MLQECPNSHFEVCVVTMSWAHMHEESVKLKADRHWSQFPKESISPALVPHTQVVNRLQNVCFLVFLFFCQGHFIVLPTIKHVTWKLETDWTPHDDKLANCGAKARPSARVKVHLELWWNHVHCSIVTAFIKVSEKLKFHLKLRRILWFNGLTFGLISSVYIWYSNKLFFIEKHEKHCWTIADVVSATP